MSKKLEIQESAVEALIREHKISISKIGAIRYDVDGSMWEADVRASMPDGQYAEDVGVSVAEETDGLTAYQSHARAKMQAFSKAKRRAVFTLLGLRYGEKEEAAVTAEVE